MGDMGRPRLVAALIAVTLAVGATPATAAVTVGQLAPGTPSATCTAGSIEIFNSSVGSGSSYVMPGSGRVTSWSTNAALGAGQTLIMKLYRKVADPNVYTVVAHDGPRPLDEHLVNTFAVDVPVKAGDVLGLNDGNAGVAPDACTFPASGALQFFGNDLSDGQSAAFEQTVTPGRANISAAFEPANAFSLGGVRANKKKGTATLTVNVPNPGELTATGNGVKAASIARGSKAVTPGEAQLLIGAKGKKKNKLVRTGKVKLNVAVTYTPTGGAPTSQSLKLKLKKQT